MDRVKRDGKHWLSRVPLGSRRKIQEREIDTATTFGHDCFWTPGTEREYRAGSQSLRRSFLPTSETQSGDASVILGLATPI